MIETRKQNGSIKVIIERVERKVYIGILLWVIEFLWHTSNRMWAVTNRTPEISNYLQRSIICSPNNKCRYFNLTAPCSTEKRFVSHKTTIIIQRTRKTAYEIKANITSWDVKRT